MDDAFDLTVDFEKTGFRPNCYPYLEALRDTRIYHDQHGLRHPRSAYSTTLSRVETAFTEVLNSFEKLKVSGDLFSAGGELLEKYRQLYYTLTEHFEACEGVARSLVPKGEEKKHPKLMPFFGKRKTYQHVDLVINAIKHRQNELVPLEFRAKYITIYGFVVSGIRSPTTVGPNLDVHKQWYGPNRNRNIETAFSFNRDLRRLFVDIYRVGALLADAMARFDVIPAPVPTSVGSKLFEIGSRIAAIPDFCFPDEREQRSFSVDVVNEEDCLTLRVRYGNAYRFPAALLTPAQVKHMITLGAEVSRIVPYLQSA